MAYVRELFAGKSTESTDWQNTGKEYYRAAQTVDQEWRNALYQKAIFAFEQALKEKANNPELLTSIGVCYVEGSAEPMKGIGYLRNAIEVDSTFAEAHFQLGLFAIQSGQFDKAESRMKKVLELKPSLISAHLYLGQIYQQIGQKSKALESLQKYKDLNSDPLIRAEVDKYLQELKNT
jgi:tetratricopeptide (TPR) repeat protein